MRVDPHRYANGDNTRWALVGYSDRTEERVSEFAVTRERLIRLRPFFDVADDLWFAHCYPVSSDVWPHVRALLQCGPPVPGVSYFVEGFATDR
ncbi:hypothetical protein [Saccharothrix luteola]|uniref:hypothetical protein n=1 Tax=Saccharothrix luteola TaxID=2893018 RepID=UPI001E58D292|nr:hypothetical protein [Saccharothrix luteola]MCC8248029.1 hypothetical protein [Saccharothrix luteola]